MSGFIDLLLSQLRGIPTYWGAYFFSSVDLTDYRGWMKQVGLVSIISASWEGTRHSVTAGFRRVGLKLLFFCLS